MGIQERKGREKEQRKEEIVDAAQRIFFEKGLQTATIDEIAEAAELSKGTIYLYYKSKEDLYLAVVMRGMQLLQDMFLSRVQTENDLLKALLAAVTSYVEFFKIHRNYFRMFQYLQTPQFHKQVSAEMKEASSLISQKTWSLVIDLLQRGIDEGVLVPDVTAAEAAVVLWTSSTSLLMRMDTETDLWKQKMNLDLEEVLRLSNALLLGALLTPSARKQNMVLLKSMHPRIQLNL